MLPLVPFIAGVLTGVAAVRLLRDRTTREKLERAQERLSDGASRVARKARVGTASGLRAVERTASAMRERLDEGEISGADADSKRNAALSKRSAGTMARDSAGATRTRSSRATTRQSASSRTRTTTTPRKAARTANVSTVNASTAHPDADSKTKADTENAEGTQ